MNPQRLEELAQTWRRQLAARDALFAAGGGLLAAALALGWVAWPLMIGAMTFALVFGARLALSRPWRFDAAQLTRHLDRTYPDLEESSGLWLCPPERLTLLERMQLSRTESALRRMEAGAVSPMVITTPPRRFLRAAWLWLGIGAISLVATGGWLRRQTETARLQGLADASLAIHKAAVAGGGSADGRSKAPRILSEELVIQPPAYTGHAERRVPGFNAEAEEGSRVTWSIALDKPMRELRLATGENDKEPAVFVATKEGRCEAQRMVTETTLVHLAGVLPDGSAWNPPELYSLKVNKDQAPGIRIVQPAVARTEVAPPAPGAADAPLVRVEALVNDDYTVQETHLVATVAKGTGEAVKFREQNLAFDANASAEAGADLPGARRLTKTLDLRALGLEPGDELYFYVAASDNRQPVVNRAKSETRFVTLKGPETQAAPPGRGVAGVNLVPQYFRSQRQIIIDTEKLIAERSALADAEFRRRANDLGIDQQLLRLRYGQFLGEELEEGQGAGDHQEISLNPLRSGIPEGVPADLVHRHDAAQSEAGDPRAGARTALRLKLQHEAEAQQGGHDHDNPGPPSAGTPPTPEQIVAPFVDQHDKGDVATFFDQSTKSTLRDALAAMWQSEGFLRTARPKEALAPENAALVILKDLQQSARSYVQRVGFEPPPLRENERRLKGDVADVSQRNAVPHVAPPETTAAAQIRATLKTLPWNERARAFLPAELEALRQAEPALTEAATRQPERFLEGLQILRKTLAERAAPGDLPRLEQTLLRLLPPAEAKPTLTAEPASALSALYFQELEQPTKAP